MGKMSEPLTIRERYLMKRCGIDASIRDNRWNNETKTYDWVEKKRPINRMRKMLKYRMNHPVRKSLTELNDRFIGGGVTVLEAWNLLFRFKWDDGCGRHVSSWPIQSVAELVIAQKDIGGLSDEEIRQRMVLEEI